MAAETRVIVELLLELGLACEIFHIIHLVFVGKQNMDADEMVAMALMEHTKDEVNEKEKREKRKRGKRILNEIKIVKSISEREGKCPGAVRKEFPPKTPPLPSETVKTETRRVSSLISFQQIWNIVLGSNK